MTHNLERVPKLAIFDPQYKNGSMPTVLDSVARELAHVSHEVTAHARTLGGAVNALLAIEREELERPDAFVVAEMLRETHTYLDHPATIRRPSEYKRWAFGEKRVGIANFLMVPIVAADDSVTLPKSSLRGMFPTFDIRRVERNAEEKGVQPGPYIITHLARYLFKDSMPLLIGHGNLGDLPMDEVTPRVTDPRRREKSLAQVVSGMVNREFARSSPLLPAQPRSS